MIPKPKPKCIPNQKFRPKPIPKPITNPKVPINSEKVFYFFYFFCQKHFHAQYPKVNVVKLLFDVIGHCLQLVLTEGKNDVVVGIDEKIVPFSSHLGSFQGTIVLPALPIVWLSMCPVGKVEGNMARRLG
jgi:hypothetical protein